MKKEETTAHSIGQLTLLHAGHGVHQGDWNFPSVYSPFVRLYYCDGGEAYTKVHGSTYRLRPGYLYLMPPFTHYSDWSTGYFSHDYMHIYIHQEVSSQSIFELLDMPIEVKASEADIRCIQRVLEINQGITLPKPYSNPKVYDNQASLVRRLSDSRKQPLWQTSETSGLLLILLSRFMQEACEKTSEIDERIQNTVVYIREHIHEPLSTKDLSARIYLSGDHFERLFKSEMGCTPTDYIKRVKIEAAEIMLAVRPTSIKDIAYTLSFESPSYFNKVFKGITGMTPSEYKKGISY